MGTSNGMKTIEEALEPYKDNESFYISYLDCIPIEAIEGNIVENANYSGYALTLSNGTRFFTPHGIRGLLTGTFKIVNEEPIRVLEIPSYKQIKHLYQILFDDPVEQLNAFKKIEKEWYNENNTDNWI